MAGDGIEDKGRTVLRVDGGDARKFLQDLVTNDVDGVGDGLVYAALLSPQGKYLFDFLLFERAGGVHLDVAADRAGALAQRLAMYRLRADVRIEPTDMKVIRGRERPAARQGALDDPRHPELGWRCYCSADDMESSDGRSDAAEARGDGGTVADPAAPDWLSIRVENCIPETGIELVPEATYILESGFERLNGVDFSKACYVGQEVTARMRHKTTLRKGLAVVRVEGRSPPGTGILSSGRAVGTLYSQANGRGIAHLRFDRVSDDMVAGDARVFPPDGLPPARR